MKKRRIVQYSSFSRLPVPNLPQNSELEVENEDSTQQRRNPEEEPKKSYASHDFEEKDDKPHRLSDIIRDLDFVKRIDKTSKVKTAAIKSSPTVKKHVKRQLTHETTT